MLMLTAIKGVIGVVTVLSLWVAIDRLFQRQLGRRAGGCGDCTGCSAVCDREEEA